MSESFLIDPSEGDGECVACAIDMRDLLDEIARDDQIDHYTRNRARQLVANFDGVTQ